MGYQETERLTRRASALEKGISVTQRLIDQAEIPGGIESIQQSILGKTRPSRISLMMESVLDQARILDEEIPPVLRKAHQALAKKESALAELRSPEEEIIQREQIFTQTQATIIAASALQKVNAVFLAPNGDELYIFKVDDEVKSILTEVASLPTDPNYQKLDDSEKLKLRNRTLQDLELLLDNPDLLIEAFEEHKFDQSMQILLLALSVQNDIVGGKLCELLTLQLNRKTVYDSRGLTVLGNQKFATLPGELARYLRSRMLQSSPKKTEPEPSQIQTPVVKTPIPVLEIPKVEKAKVSGIVRRDPEVEARISAILDEIDQKEVARWGEIIKSGILNRLFPVLKQMVVEEMIDSSVVTKKNKDGVTAFNITDVAAMLYAYKYGKKGGLNQRLVKDLFAIITNQQEQRKKLKGPQANGSGK